MRWLSENYKWLLDGVAGAAILAVIGYVAHRLLGSKTANVPAPPVNVPLPAPTPAPPTAKEEKEPPPCLSFVQPRSVLLHQDSTGVWHEASSNLEQANRGLVAQFRNRPNKVGQQAPKASSVIASLIFKSPEAPELLHINHAVWLGRYEQFASFHAGETHQLLLVVKLIPYVTFENPNTTNPFVGTCQSEMSVRQPQVLVLPGTHGDVEITLVDACNVTVFTGLFDYRVTTEQMYLRQKI
jgi:hypothetical protein